MRDHYFTVCIPSYNRAYVLDRCLGSLCRQNNIDFEVIFVDDGSTDNTEQLVQSYTDRLNIKYIRKENGGKHTALNVGLEAASNTELFLVLDSDDWLGENELNFFKDTWESIPKKDRERYCGIAGKCQDQDGNRLGELFPESPYEMSYIDMHFRGKNYGDCCECTRTEIIKKYRFPEPEETKFVPEYYIYDQIGIKYTLYCVNNIVRNKEYMNDGITKSIKEYFKKNCVGYSYGLVCRIEKVFPKVRTIPVKARILTWYEYWKACYFDKKKLGARVKYITPAGMCGKLMFLTKRLLVALSIKETI